MKLIVFHILLMCALGASNAFALPIFGENVFINDGVPVNATILRDSRDPNLLYYFPNSARFIADPQTQIPTFGFTYWGLSAPAGSLDAAGGYLSFLMKPGVDDQLRSVLDRLLKKGSQLAMIPVHSSIVTFQGSDVAAHQELFKSMALAKAAGRGEDEIGVNVLLTGLGAKFVRGALRTENALNMFYCYKIEGLSPQFTGRIFVDWKQIYEHFTVKFKTGRFFFKAEVSREMEQLIQKGYIRVTLDGGNDVKREYMIGLLDDLIEMMFKVDAPMGRADGGSGGSGFLYGRVSLGSYESRTFKTWDFELNERQLQKREYCIPLPVKNLRPYLSQIMSDADQE